jgi:hypothetical protein
MSPILPGIVASGISGHLFTPEGSAYEIAKYTVPSGGISTVTFAVPSGYRHVRIEFSMLTTANGGSPQIRFNGDSGSNYSNHILYSSGSAGGTGYNASNTGMYIGGSNIGTNTTYPLVATTDLLDYSSTTKNKTIRTLSGADQNGSGEISLFSGCWYNSTSPVTSIDIFAAGKTISQYSTFTLIGYK